MKAFLIILIIAALGGGGYYYFIHQGNSPADLLGKDRSSMATESPSNGISSKPGAPAVSRDRPPATASSGKAAAKAEKAGARPSAKKAEAPKSEIDLLVEKRYPMPIIHPLDQITQNWTAVPANAYPQQITASEPVAFELVINGQKAGETKLPPGTPLKPVQLSGNQLAIASLANPSMRTTIDVDKTNFKQSIEQRYNEFVVFKKKQIAELREKAKRALLAQPDRVASLTRTGPGDSSDDPRFGPVKASINRGEAYPASLDEATSFQWNGSERIGGEIRGTYDTVSVHFEVKTIFGKFPTDYKCLLRGGQVVGWIDPITEEKITRQ